MKTLCKLSKNVEENIEDILSLSKNADAVCMKCGRVSNNEEALCTAKSFGEKTNKKYTSDYTKLLKTRYK